MADAENCIKIILTQGKALKPQQQPQCQPANHCPLLKVNIMIDHQLQFRN